jgi:hypothetical protein
LTSRLTSRLLAAAACLLFAGSLAGIPTSASAASGPRPATSPIEAESYSSQHGTDKKTTPAPYPWARYLGQISNSNWTKYNNIDFGAGVHTWSITFSSPKSAAFVGYVSLHIDGLDTPPITEIVVYNTGSWFSWSTVSAPLPYPITGVHQVELRFVTNYSDGFMNLDKFQFS